jgi:hypothetical protein
MAAHLIGPNKKQSKRLTAALNNCVMLKIQTFYITVNPFTLITGQPLFGTTRRFALQELLMTHLML